MKIDGKVSIFVGSEGATIELHDSDSGITFVRVKMTTAQFCGAIGRLAYSECVEMHVPDIGIKNIGKKLEIEKFVFELPENIDRYSDKNILAEMAQKQAPEGWIADSYFGSHDSFFTNREDGKKYARVTIRRWVDKD